MDTLKLIKYNKVKRIAHSLYSEKYNTRLFKRDVQKIFENHLAKILRKEFNSNNVTVIIKEYNMFNNRFYLEIYTFNEIIFEGDILK